MLLSLWSNPVNPQIYKQILISSKYVFLIFFYGKGHYEVIQIKIIKRNINTTVIFHIWYEFKCFQEEGR
jgi:hypothetical protein